MSRIARDAGYDASQLCADMVMNWNEIRALAQDPLVTIGAHTRHHYALAKLSEADVRTEIALSVRRIEQELGRPCVHFSFPYGDATSAGEREFAIAKDLGLTTAVTTQKGVLTSAHADCMTGLPRVSINGDYQKSRYVRGHVDGVAVRSARLRQAAAGLREGRAWRPQPPSGRCIHVINAPAGSTQRSPATT